ncbi:unnamed protein product [Ectocarpus sp. 12 AP-2014]
MTEKIDIYRMGLVFQHILAAAGVKMPVAKESRDDVPVVATPWHWSYYEVRGCSLCSSTSLTC